MLTRHRRTILVRTDQLHAVANTVSEVINAFRPRTSVVSAIGEGRRIEFGWPFFLALSHRGRTLRVTRGIIEIRRAPAASDESPIVEIVCSLYAGPAMVLGGFFVVVFAGMLYRAAPYWWPLVAVILVLGVPFVAIIVAADSANTLARTIDKAMRRFEDEPRRGFEVT